MTDAGADETIVAAMLAASMKALTGAGSSQEAWAQFVAPEDRVGIKVNPVGAPVSSTTHELTRAVIAALRNKTAVGVSGNLMLKEFENDVGNATVS